MSDKEKPHLFQCLTKAEFQTCWALRMTQGFESFDDAYPLDSYPSPGSPDIADSYEEQMRRAIRFLALDHGFEFSGVTCYDDGRMDCVEVEPRNAVYVRSIQLYLMSDGAVGAMPHPLKAIEVAIETLEEHAPSVSIAPLQQLARELDQAVEATPEPEPEAYAEYQKDIAEGLAAIGVKQKGMIH